MPNSILAVCCFCLSLLVGSASAQTASEVVIEAFKGFDQDYREKWASMNYERTERRPGLADLALNQEACGH